MTIARTVSMEEFERLMVAAGKKAPAALKNAMRAAVQAMIRDVVANRLSNQYLRVDTGGARRSITGEVRGGGERILGVIGSPLRYVRAHEEGFKGSVQVRAHTRRRSSLETRSGKATKKSVKAVKARLRAGRSGYSHVKAHSRFMNIRARRFLRDTVLQEAGALPTMLASGVAPFTRRATKALKILLLFSRVPKVSELGIK